MKHLLSWIYLLAVVTTASAAPAGSWDFEKGFTGWSKPNAESGVIAEPGNPQNHGFQIVATKPHHTQLFLENSEVAPDFIATARFKVLAWEGESPTIYLNGRVGNSGFRGLSIRDASAAVTCYFGQQQNNPRFGNVRVTPKVTNKTWVRAAVACYRNQVFAKVWADGTPEPKWQMRGEAEGQPSGRFAVVVWTSPRTPSKAQVLFDDLTFHPLTEKDLAAFKIETIGRPPLDLAKAPTADGLFETTELAGLVKGQTVLAFNRKSGGLTHLIHRPTGQDFIATNDLRPLFHLQLSQANASQLQELSAEDFRTITLHKASSTTWELDYTDHPTLPLRVRATLGLGNDEQIHFRIAISNRTTSAVTAIRFPDMAWAATLGKQVEDDRLVLPWMDGAVLPKPGASGRSGIQEYPGHAFTQFTAYYDQTGGVYFGALDTEGHCKRWELRSSPGKSLQMTLEHLRPEEPGRDVVLSYDTVLSTFVGDWMDAADIYKRWAKSQPWCAKTLTQRTDIPQFLKDGAGIIIAGIQNQKGYNGLLGDQLEKLPALMTEYRRRTELAHMVFVPYGWENRGTWVGINYFPTVPSDEAWRNACVKLREQGDRVAFLTSGYWWVIKRKTAQNGPAFDDSAEFERRKDMVIWGADGKPFFFDNYDNHITGADWRGLSAKLCHGSPAASQVMKEIFLQAARLGVPLISFDQEIGGGQREPCYRASHGHPLGYGNYMWTGFRDVCDQILKEGKPIQPELGLFMENVSELAIPYAATYWSRQFGEIDHVQPGARGIALFSYLYHEYVTCIGAACVQGQGAKQSRPSAEMRSYILANNLTRGLLPGPFMQDVPLAAKDAWHDTVMQAYFSFCKPYSRFPEYLVMGITRRPFPVECAEQEVEYWRNDANGTAQKPDGPKISKAKLKLPTITTGSFEAADGSVGTIIVNTTGKPQVATLKLPGHGKIARLYRANRTEIQSWEKVFSTLPLTLEPYESQMLILR